MNDCSAGSPHTPQQLFRWFRQHPLDADWKAAVSRSTALQRLVATPLPASQFIYIVNIPQASLVYVSPTLKGVLGYHSSEITDPFFFYDLIHPADLSTVCIATYKSVRYASLFQNTAPLEGIFSMDYRMRSKGGNWVRIRRDSGVLARDTVGNVLYTLSWCTDISAFKDSPLIAFDYKGPALPGLVFPDAEMQISDVLLTTRELEVIRLIARGESSKQMAQLLRLSVHTVNTHRRRILQKINASNTAEVIRYASAHKLI
jgi:DNA-binding CsgD family transcriptional regulator